MSAERTCVVAIDAGTTGVRSRAVFVAADGPSVSAYRELTQHYPEPGWVEHDASEIWDRVLETLVEVTERLRADGIGIAAIGITNQRETAVAWSRSTGLPHGTAIVWQDRRTAARCDELAASGALPLVRERTGLVLDPYFSATKIAWLLDNVPGARARAERGELAFGTIDSWLVWKLTHGESHVTDSSNASRTLLLDIATGDDDFPVFPEPVTESDPTIDNAEQTYSPLKAAMERVLLGTPDLPVSILRPQAIHGPHGAFLREWFFVKRALDARPHVVLAYEGLSRFGTTSTATIAELVRLCAERPGVRVLNAADENAPTVREIGEAVFDMLGREVRLIGMPGEARGDLGTSPWAVPNPFVLSMDRAAAEIGYLPLGTYRELVAPAIEWIVDAAAAAHAEGRTWREAFPRLVERYGADSWFDYDAEDAYVAGL
jgi:hypothetical protein